MEGWIKLHRKLQDNGLWTCEPFTRGQAWVDLLLLASHTNSFFYVRGIKINLERGQLAWGEVKLSERWKWSRSKLRKFLNDLEKEQQIEQQKDNVIQIVTIVNYDEYQQKEQQNVQQKDNRKTTEGQQKDIYKNVKKYKNVKNDKKIAEDYDLIFIEWFSYKDERKEYYVDSGMKKLISQIFNKYKTAKEFKRDVDFSMAKNYKGIFTENNTTQNRPGKPRNPNSSDFSTNENT